MNATTGKEELKQCALKYRQLRRQTFELLEEESSRATAYRVIVTAIDEVALNAYKSQWPQGMRKVQWDWEVAIMETLYKSHPRRLDMAFWVEKQLCGLAVARLSDAKVWLSITHVEGCPLPTHPLKRMVVPFAIRGAEIYSGLLHEENSQNNPPIVRVLRPLEKAIGRYIDSGYSNSDEESTFTFLTRP